MERVGPAVGQILRISSLIELICVVFDSRSVPSECGFLAGISLGMSYDW